MFTKEEPMKIRDVILSVWSIVGKNNNNERNVYVIFSGTKTRSWKVLIMLNQKLVCYFQNNNTLKNTQAFVNGLYSQAKKQQEQENPWEMLTET